MITAVDAAPDWRILSRCCGTPPSALFHPLSPTAVGEVGNSGYSPDELARVRIDLTR
jgi:hypothetical protein